MAATGPGGLLSRHGRSGIDKRPVTGPVFLDVGGVAGDRIGDLRHHGGAEQAVYAYAAEDLAFWAAELDRPMGPGRVGENLTLSGVDCSGSVIGERWQVGAAVLRVTAPRIPCSTFAGFVQVPDLVGRFLAAGRPGCYLAVERPADVQGGDPVHVVDRPAHGVTVAEVMAAVGGRRELLQRVASARGDFGPRGRKWLDRTLAAIERTPARE
nr:MOSC domain-containing protein [Pseudonocardia acidicola]